MSLSGHVLGKHQNGSIWNEHYIINAVKEVYRQNKNQYKTVETQPASTMNRIQPTTSSHHHGNPNNPRSESLHPTVSADVAQNVNRPSGGWMQSLAEFLKQNNPYKQDSASSNRTVENPEGSNNSVTPAQNIDAQQKQTGSPPNLMKQYPQLSKLVATEQDGVDSREALDSNTAIVIGDSDDSIEITDITSSPEDHSQRVGPPDVMSPSTRSYVEDWLNSSMHFAENCMEDDNIINDNFHSDNNNETTTLAPSNNENMESTPTNQVPDEPPLTLKRSPSFSGDSNEHVEKSNNKRKKVNNKVAQGEPIIIDDSDSDPETTNDERLPSPETNNNAKSISAGNSSTDKNIFNNIQTEVGETTTVSKDDGSSTKSRSSKMISSTEMAKTLLTGLRNILSKQSTSKPPNTEVPVTTSAVVSMEEKQKQVSSSVYTSSSTEPKHCQVQQGKSRPNVISQNALGNLIDSEEKLNEYQQVLTPINTDKAFVDSPKSSELESPHLLTSSGGSNNNSGNTPSSTINTTYTCTSAVNLASVSTNAVLTSTASQNGTYANAKKSSVTTLRPIEPKPPSASNPDHISVKKNICKPNILSRRSSHHSGCPPVTIGPVHSVPQTTVVQAQSTPGIASGLTQPLMAVPLIPVSIVPVVPINIRQNGQSVPSVLGPLNRISSSSATSTSSVLGSGLNASTSKQFNRSISNMSAYSQKGSNFNGLSNHQQASSVFAPAQSSLPSYQTTSHGLKPMPVVGASRNTRTLSIPASNLAQHHKSSRAAPAVRTYSMMVEGPQCQTLEACIRHPSSKTVSNLEAVMNPELVFTVVPVCKLNLPDISDPGTAAVALIPDSDRQYVMLSHFTDVDEGENWIKALKHSS